MNTTNNKGHALAGAPLKTLRGNSTTTLAQVAQALTFIDATDRNTWIDCGMAIKAEFDDSGFDVWERWSSMADNYSARAAAASWKSFTSGGGINIGTLFHYAKQGGYVHNTTGKPTPPTAEEIAQREAKRNADIEALAKRRLAAASKAQALWNAPPSALEATKPSVTEHPYIKRKGIMSHGVKVFRRTLSIGGMDCNGALMIPLMLDGKITSLQFINRDGEKRFLPDGEKGGFVIGKIEASTPVCICEGYATGASIHEATGYAVMVAFDAGNLKKLATALRANKPDMQIILCADDDAAGTGQRKATEAAQSVGGLVAMPVFGEPRLEGVKDFNDMAIVQGLDAVKVAIEAAHPMITPSADALGTDLTRLQGADDSDAQSWPNPQPLTAEIEPEPYPLDALPLPIRAAVEEVAGFVKAPVPMVASSALAALSLAGQAHADAKRAEKLHGPVGLFLLTIADSGERKSTCDGFFTQAIRDYEEAQAEAAKPALKDNRAAIEAWEAKRGGIKEKIRQLAKSSKPTADMESSLRDLEHDKPESLRIPRLMYADATPEALAYGLAKQWPSGGVVSAEAGIVFGSHGMGKDSVMRNLGLLNQLWDGISLTIDRRSTESFTVRGARLTVALQVQEPTLREFFTRSGALARGTGFLARFLVAWPESTQGQRSFTEPPANWPHLAAFHLRIAGMLDQPAPIDEDGALTTAMLMLTPEAKRAWVEYHDAIERELSSGGELYDVRDVASKSADNAVRLAALFQMFEHGMAGAISLIAFAGASRIAAWHLHEARRFFGELALPAELADAARLDSWLIEYCKRERTHLVTTREAQRLGPIRDKEKLTSALRELEELDRVKVAQEGRRKIIKMNPALAVTP